MRWFYRAYGLLLECNRAIPGLSPLAAPANPDKSSRYSSPVVVELIDFETRQLRPHTDSPDWLQYSMLGIADGPACRQWTRTTAEGTYHRLQYTDANDFAEYTIHPAADKVEVAWTAGVPLEEVSVLLLGVILGRVLRLRGILCLHANAVFVAGAAILILGPKGAGKSTTTAALIQNGCSLIADDIAALTERNGKFWIAPGVPGLRLSRDTGIRLFGENPRLRPMWQKKQKRPTKFYLNLSDEMAAFYSKPAPLSLIYILHTRDTFARKPTFGSVSPAHRLPLLSAHSYANEVLTKSERAAEFATLGRLASQVQIRTMQCPDNLGKLDEVYSGLLQDIKQLGVVLR